MATAADGSDDVEEMELSTEEMANRLSEVYATYPVVNVDGQIKKLEGNVESMLLRLDEFSSLLDQVRQESESVTEGYLPELQSKCMEMNKVFEKVEKLEAFVSIVRSNVDAIEERVELAEKELDTNTFKKALSSLPLSGLFSRKKSSQQPNQKMPTKNWQPPELFKTADYFQSSQTDQ
ncbi:Biogenesis of lysosome-related organelles complex 1 subunit 4 [Trichoplax sp. H2]|uniref:Biogenesis of lysosome-related organelles complex 1 subunit 4 n=1 Tax=Trichoplax adhaerens TaxID=10228 RepID=B3RV81_TRIAD|nr:hypothetical protein TRIADDRAFT_55559 [Trichoplax adhaerens]EDV25457.1 hypothetical protein TRIADDRAFT_55559 [Trichoplax adhaerens]RDD44162.1 Biogenesis of lysosome-related organelles complex 1 subunit 4 [Trichoplax sp. H2]|eukprot:XP_002111490.1 hypothetical protein TRIADDRAFT_55559 [Trichoplax adhaerens]